MFRRKRGYRVTTSNVFSLNEIMMTIVVVAILAISITAYTSVQLCEAKIEEETSKIISAE